MVNITGVEAGTATVKVSAKAKTKTGKVLTKNIKVTVKSASAYKASGSVRIYGSIKDGITEGITGGKYAALLGSNISASILNLVAAGKLTINGAALPVKKSDGSYSATEFYRNEEKVLWQEDDGTWSFEAHIRDDSYKGSHMAYEDAILKFVNANSRQDGGYYDVSYKYNGTRNVITAIDFLIPIAGFAHSVNKGSTYTTLTSTDPAATGDALAEIQFPNENITGTIEPQSVVFYWKDAKTGWNLKSAVKSVTTMKELVISQDAEGHESPVPSINGLSEWQDTNLASESIAMSNKPSQPLFAMMWMGDLENVSLIRWEVAPGVTGGFSLGSGARAKLQEAVDKAQKALDETPVSAAGDGSDIEKGVGYVTKEYHDIFAQAIADAKSDLSNASLTSDQIEMRLFHLAQAYGGHTGDFMSRRSSNTIAAYFGEYDGTGFVTYASEHTGTK